MAGGGVGEAMLIGAAVGAGTGGVMSAVQDKDVGQGMLLGALGGAATGGIGSGIGGAASTAVENVAANAAANTATDIAANTAASAATDTLASTAANTAANTAAENSLSALAQQGTNQAASSMAAMPNLASTAPNINAGIGNLAAEGASQGAAGMGQGIFPGMSNANVAGAATTGGISGLLAANGQPAPYQAPETETYNGPLSKFKMAGPALTDYKYDPNTFKPSIAPGFASGGIADLDAPNMYPQSQYENTMFNIPRQTPVSKNVLGPSYDTSVDMYTGEELMARGGIADLGSYSDGGRLLRGPGDGMSDNIPASIAGKQPARLADGEFVVPADVVSHLGNGSTDAGAKTLYSMMDKVRKARTGNKKQGREIDADKYVPGMADGGIARFDEGGDVLFGEMEESTPEPQASAPGYTPSIYNPYYYNPRVYQGQLDAANQKIAQLQSVKAFDPSWYLKQNADVAASQTYGSNPYQHYLDWGLKEGRSPYEGGQAGVALQDPAAIAAAQQEAVEPQKNVDRLANSSIKYNDYTLANRPSGNEPQYYGNIYKIPEGYGQYIREGYDMNAGLGVWNNEYDGDRTATNRQTKIAETAAAQNAASDQAFQQAQAAAQKSLAKEEKKRRGGILDLRRA